MCSVAVNAEDEQVKNMASKGKSAQLKGKKFEREIANYLKKEFGIEVRRTPSQERWKIKNQGDVNAMGESVLNRFHIEAKNHETVLIKEWYRKAKDDAHSRIPVVVFKIPQTSIILCTLSIEHLTRTLVELDGYLAEENKE